VTAVGGTSLFLNGDNSYSFETGWGTNLTRIGTCGAKHTDSDGLLTCDAYNKAGALDYGFDGGAGGGLSNNFAAQPWQSAAIGGATAAGFGTVGSHRAVPDVGLLADPYTGANVYITDLSAGDTSPEIEPYGGTSVACPLFAGVMALVDQVRAGNGLGATGLATPHLYAVGAGAYNDITNPPAGVGNPTPDAAANAFALYYGSRYSGSLFFPTFNQDSSLAVSGGWDDVTGLGTPHGATFVNAMGSVQ
jgi:subtilase family serine protease